MTSEREVGAELDRWAEAGRGEEMAHGHGHATRQALKFVQLDEARFLDIGCGIGWTLDLARQRGARLAVGIDRSTGMLKRGRRHGRDGLAVASAARLPFGDATFDVVLSVEALYYTMDLDRALAESRRVLAPGGRLVVVVDLYAESPVCGAWVDALAVPVHVLNRPQWEQALAGAGLDGVESRMVRDPTPPVTRGSFEPSRWYPTWEAYAGFREMGSLLLTGEKDRAS